MYIHFHSTSQFDEARDKWPNIDWFYRKMTTPQRRETEQFSIHIKSKLQMRGWGGHGGKLLLSEQDSIKKMCLALTGQIPGIGDFHRSQF